MKFNKIAASALLVACGSLLNSGSASAFTPYTVPLSLNDNAWLASNGGVTFTNGTDSLNYQLQSASSYPGLQPNAVVDINWDGTYYNLNIDHGPNPSVTTTTPGSGTFTWNITANKQFNTAKVNALYNLSPIGTNIVHSTYTSGPTLDILANGANDGPKSFAAGVTSTTLVSTITDTGSLARQVGNGVSLKNVPFEFSPEQGFMLGVPLFLGLRQLKKRTSAKKQIGQ